MNLGSIRRLAGLSTLVLAMLLVGLPARAEKAEKLSAKISQCKKTKVRNSEGRLVYVFTVVSRQVSQHHNSQSILYVEVQDATGARYFGQRQNERSLLSFVCGGSFSDVTWKFEVDVNDLKNPQIKAYEVDLLNETDGSVIDRSKYAVGDVEKWKKDNEKSKALTVNIMKPDPNL